MAEVSEGTGVSKARKNKAAKSEQNLKLAKREMQQKKGTAGLKKYLSETWAEMKKIVWPTPKSVTNNTIAVLVFMVIVGAFIWILDALTSTGFTHFIALFTK